MAKQGMLTKEATKDLEKIERLSTDLEKQRSSPDPRVAKKAQAQLGRVGVELREWAKKHKVKLLKHSEPPRDQLPPAAPRGCKGIFTPKIDGKFHVCFLVGTTAEGACVYECFLNSPTA